VVTDIFYLISLLSLICITCRQMLRATNNMDVDEADVQHISSPIAYHADLVDPAYESEATLVYDIAEEDATEVGAVMKSTRARSGGRIQVSSLFLFCC
jgi:hypothetical protein